MAGLQDICPIRSRLRVRSAVLAPSLAAAECREDSSEDLIGCRLTSYFSQTAERVVKPHKYKFLAGLRLKQGKGRLNGVDRALQQIMMPGICYKQALALPVSVRKKFQYGGP